MIRWNDAPASIDIEGAANAAFQTDIYRKVASKLSVPYPMIDQKVEGANMAPWVLSDASEPIAFCSDKFIDNRIFDPESVEAYLAGFATSRSEETITPQRLSVAKG